MKQVRREDIIEVVGCDIESRPMAPGLDELRLLAVSIQRTVTSIDVEFPLSALDIVESFAAAERVCCAGIQWDVETSSVVTLRIGSSDLALDAFQDLFSSIRI